MQVEDPLEEGHSNPLQYFPQNPMDRGAGGPTGSMESRKESDTMKHTHNAMLHASQVLGAFGGFSRNG